VNPRDYCLLGPNPLTYGGPKIKQITSI